MTRKKESIVERLKKEKVKDAPLLTEIQPRKKDANRSQISDHFSIKSELYEFSINIEPVAKKRVRVYSKGGRVHGVNPSKEDEDAIRRLLLENKGIPSQPLKGAALLGMKFYRSVPKSLRKKDRPFVATEQYRPIKRPDLDNYIKLFKDAATGILWEDDNLIVGYLPGTGKYYTLEEPRIEVQLVTLGSDFKEIYSALLEKEMKRITSLFSTLDDFVE